MTKLHIIIEMASRTEIELGQREAFMCGRYRKPLAIEFTPKLFNVLLQAATAAEMVSDETFAPSYTQPGYTATFRTSGYVIFELRNQGEGYVSAIPIRVQSLLHGFELSEKVLQSPINTKAPAPNYIVASQLDDRPIAEHVHLRLGQYTDTPAGLLHAIKNSLGRAYTNSMSDRNRREANPVPYEDTFISLNCDSITDRPLDSFSRIRVNTLADPSDSSDDDASPEVNVINSNERQLFNDAFTNLKPAWVPEGKIKSLLDFYWDIRTNDMRDDVVNYAFNQLFVHVDDVLLDVHHPAFDERTAHLWQWCIALGEELQQQTN